MSIYYRDDDDNDHWWFGEDEPTLFDAFATLATLVVIALVVSGGASLVAVVAWLVGRGIGIIA